MSFCIRGLPSQPFQPFFGLSDAELAQHHILRVPVQARHCAPDRVSLTDLEIGQTALLLNYEHLAEPTPYRSRHAIYVKEGGSESGLFEGEVPEMLTRRIVALRGIDNAGHIVDADLATGDDIKTLIARLFAISEVAYIHAHFAKRGCFACRIDRASA